MVGHIDCCEFFDQGLTPLPTNYFAIHDSQCYICQDEPGALAPQPLSKTDTYSRLIIRIKACSHVFHQGCLGEWVVRSYQDSGTATCPMCRAVLASRPHEVESYLQAKDMRAHMRRMLPHALVDQVEKLNARVDRSDAESYELYLQIIRIAGLMDAVGLYVDHGVVRHMTDFVQEYERKNRLRFVWRDIRRRSRSLFRRRPATKHR